ncbi:hypothetical protein JIG36_11555 [Actinoplanes sp. LDG1-06]|uniref:Lipoprotein n=1 Tax=Paractinoplanes ovalisporus TaxID=2810368 RepID=A0ABS2A8L9_9ACTN|nr:hypothetical protein [Actinoplanes ovalisporus]MBM2616192.1 hypothetical protein [Actinoplanes ovalisporus]
MLTWGRTYVGLGLGLVLLAAGGCTADPEPEQPQRTVEVCVRPDAAHREGEQVRVELKDGQLVVASGSITVPGRFSAQAPADRTVDISVEGVAAGSAGPSGNTAIVGCGDLAG